MILVLLTILAVLATLRLTVRTIYADLSVGAAAIFSIALVVSFLVTTSSLLACIAGFNTTSFVVALSVYCATIFWFSTRFGDREKPVLSKIDTIAPLLVAVLAAILYLPPSRIDVGGQDPACYVAAASILAYNGRMQLHSPAYAAFSEEELSTRLNVPAKESIFRPIFNGIYLMGGGGGQIDIAFPRGPSYLLGVGFLVSRSSVAYLSNSLYAFLALFSFFMVARCLLPFGAAFAATLLLALCPAQIWFGRATYSEVCSQFYIFFALFHLFRVFRFSPTVTAQNPASATAPMLVAIWAIGLSALMRVDQALVSCALILALPFAAPDYFRKQRVLSFQMLLVASLAGVSYDTWLLSRTHYLYYYPSQLFISQFPWFYAGCCGVLSSPLYFDRAREIARGRMQQVFVGLRTEWATVLLVLAIAALFVWGVSIRTQISEIPYFGPEAMHNANVRKMNDQIFPRLGVLVGLPILLLAFFGMLQVVRSAGVSPAFLLLAAVCCGYCCKLLVDQQNSPMLYWASRRYVPIIVPSLILFGTAALSRLSVFGRTTHNRLLQWGLVAVSIVPMLMLDKEMLWWGEMNGADSAAVRLRQVFSPEKTILVADTSERKRGFTLRFLGNFDVLLVPGLSADPQLLSWVQEKLRPLGKQLIYFSAERKNPLFVPDIPVQHILAPYRRLGEEIERFPNSSHPLEHGIFYQLR